MALGVAEGQVVVQSGHEFGRVGAISALHFIILHKHTSPDPFCRSIELVNHFPET